MTPFSFPTPLGPAQLLAPTSPSRVFIKGSLCFHHKYSPNTFLKGLLIIVEHLLWLKQLGHILTADEMVVRDGLMDGFILMEAFITYIRKNTEPAPVILQM